MRPLTRIASLLVAFVLAASALAQQTSTSAVSGASSGREHNQQVPPAGCNPILGQPNYIPFWLNATVLGSSVMYQDPNMKNIGVGTNAPAATLDVNGGMNVATNYEIGGISVLTDVPANYSLFIGDHAGNIANHGLQNIFVGSYAGAYGTTGSSNSFFGAATGSQNVGSYNTFVGAAAGSKNISASNNTFVGFLAGQNTRSGGNNTFIGSNAGFDNDAGSNNIYVGTVGPANDENRTIRIGDQNQTSAFIAGIYGSTASSGVPVYINSNGQLGTQTSSLRFKENIRDMGESTNGLMRLHPVTFLYKPEYDKGERTLQYGLIAEEVAQVYPELVANDKDGRPYTVRYQYLTTMLLNEAQKQYHRAEVQAKVITEQEQKIDELEQRLSRLERMVGNQVQTVAHK